MTDRDSPDRPAGPMDGPAGVVDGPAGVVDGPAGVVDGPAGVVDGPAGVAGGSAGVADGSAGVGCADAGVAEGTDGVAGMPGGSVVTAKSRLRRRLLAARAALSAGEREAAGAALMAHVLAAAPVRAARVVAAYVPVGTEPGSAALLDRLRARGVRVLLPIALPDRSLDWAAYDGGLVPAGYGLLEPTGQRLGAAALSGVDAVLAPGLAVDRRGVRLGRGAGYYDRALAAATCPVAVLLYDAELLTEDLPAGPHDRHVDAAITPGLGWVDLGKRQ